MQAIPGAVPSLDALPEGCRFHPRCAHAFSICSLITPQLQAIEAREVRCHLYPEYERPPAIAMKETNHMVKREALKSYCR